MILERMHTICLCVIRWMKVVTGGPPFLSDEFKNIILQENFDTITARVIYDGFETDLLKEESTGVRKLFIFVSRDKKCKKRW